MVSNRNMIVSYYVTQDEATGVCTVVSTSAGNDAFEVSEADKIGSNVVGHLIFSYLKFIPSAEGGYDIEQASCFNPEGWLPGFV